MNKILLFIILSVPGIFLSCNQEPWEIYVAVTGDEQASGTIDQPVQTIEKARELALSSTGNKEVNILLNDGIYYLNSTLVFTAEHSGSKKHPLVLRAVNDNKAIVSGGMKIHLQWEAYKNGIYQASVSEDVAIDQLYVNGKRQRMARYPNAVEGKNVFDAWELVHTQEPDPANDPLTPERISSWSNPEGAFVHAMHKALWGDMHWLVKGRNADGTLDLEGGWQNNRPTPMHPRYRMVENVFEELDTPGEWYYKQDEKTLYYFPLPETDLTAAKIEIVRLKHLIEFNGSREEPVRFIRLEGIVFRHASRSFMDNKEPLLRSDWTTYRGGAVFFNGAEDCSVYNCEFDQLGGNSIFVSNYNSRIRIQGCHIHHSGANGIAFVGDPASVRSPIFRYGDQDFKNMDRVPGPIGDNYPQDCQVEDCLITMTGRDEKQTAPVQISMSYKILVSHCSVYDVPRAGININDGTFGGHIVEYCDVFNTVLETGDHGSFNSWGRDRFWTPDINETAKEVAREPGLPKLDMLAPNIIRNSRWRCDHGWDIDLDDGSSWFRVYNNLMLNGGLKMREGYDRIATNNIILNNSLHPHVWYPRSGDVFKYNIVYGAYRPAAMLRGLAIDDKWGAQLDSNLFATGHEDRTKFAINGCDAHSLAGDPLFMDKEKKDFRVRDDSPALQIGFTNFPTNEFGVVSEKLKLLAKQPEIPDITISKGEGSGNIYQWKGASLKNIETWGEQSAYGLSAMSGVALSDVPPDSELAKLGFLTGDVILQYESVNIKNYAQLLNEAKKNESKKEIVILFMRNQKPEEISYRMSH